jgi:hypothetical protein
MKVKLLIDYKSKTNKRTLKIGTIGEVLTTRKGGLGKQYLTKFKGVVCPIHFEQNEVEEEK